MFGHRHCDSHGQWAAGRHGRRFGHGGPGWGGRGMGGDDTMRAGRRMLAQGDLRLIALALIAEQPRHGYDIMKALEEKTAGWYSPSPGIVYPTLTYLEEVGYVTAEAEGSKKLYTITDEGRAYLDDNRELADAVLERLAAVGAKISRMRRDEREEERDDEALPRSVKGAFEDLREAVRDLMRSDADAKSRIIEIIDRATGELRKH